MFKETYQIEKEINQHKLTSIDDNIVLYKLLHKTVVEDGAFIITRNNLKRFTNEK